MKKPVSPELVVNSDFAENKSSATMFGPAVIKHKNMPKDKLRIFVLIKIYLQKVDVLQKLVYHYRQFQHH
jgi:hypothetical protein